MPSAESVGPPPAHSVHGHLTGAAAPRRHWPSAVGGRGLGRRARHPVTPRPARSRRARAGPRPAPLDAERAASAERLRAARAEQERLAEQFQALAAQALRHNNEAFLTLADERLKASQQAQAGELEPRRLAVDAAWSSRSRSTSAGRDPVERQRPGPGRAPTPRSTEQVRVHGRDRVDAARARPQQLVTALRRPAGRAAAGASCSCARSSSSPAWSSTATSRPRRPSPSDDGVTAPTSSSTWPAASSVVVDSKVSLAAFLDAPKATDADVRDERLEAHARHLSTHVDAARRQVVLGAVHAAPEFVVLFVPGEAMLAQALETDPSLIEHATGKGVLLASPLTLIAMLRTAAYAWKQTTLAENARKVFELGPWPLQAAQHDGRPPRPARPLADRVGEGVQPGGRVAGAPGAAERPPAERPRGGRHAAAVAGPGRRARTPARGGRAGHVRRRRAPGPPAQRHAASTTSPSTRATASTRASTTTRGDAFDDACGERRGVAFDRRGPDPRARPGPAAGGPARTRPDRRRGGRRRLRHLAGRHPARRVHRRRHRLAVRRVLRPSGRRYAALQVREGDLPGPSSSRRWSSPSSSSSHEGRRHATGRPARQGRRRARTALLDYGPMLWIGTGLGRRDRGLVRRLLGRR